MANIPVERKGGTPWWVWLLALLALIGLIWLLAELFSDDDEVEVAAVDPIEEPIVEDFDCPAVEADAVTTVDQITNAGGMDLVGCQVDLAQMRVIELTGDSSFFMAPTMDGGAGVLVVLQGMNESESLPPPPTGADGEYNIDEGDTVSITGEVSSFDATAPDYAELSGDRSRLLPTGIYVNANNVMMDEEM